MDEIDDSDEVDDEERFGAQVRQVAASFLEEAGPLALDRLVDLLAEAGTSTRCWPTVTTATNSSTSWTTSLRRPTTSSAPRTG